VRRALGILLLPLYLAGSVSVGDDWPQWRGPNRDGVSRETDWLHQWPPVEQWRVTLAPGYSSMSISDGKLYTMGQCVVSGKPASNIVYCLDVRDGSEIWSTAYATLGNGYRASFATPTVQDGRVYTFSSRGQIHCFDKLTGSNVWGVTEYWGSPNHKPSSSPLVEGDLVVVNMSGSGVAVHKDTGVRVWPATPAGKAGYSSAIAFTWNSQRILALTAHRTVFGLRPTTGEQIWSHHWHSLGDNSPDPVLYGNKLLLSGTSWQLFEERRGILLPVWPRAREIWSDTSSPVLIGDYVYGFGLVPDGEMGIVCMDIRDGTVQWASHGPHVPYHAEGALSAAGDKLIVQDYHPSWTSAQPYLHILEATPAGYNTGGREPYATGCDARGVADCTRCMPVLSDGKIYCRGFSTLVCLQVGRPEEQFRLHFDAAVSESAGTITGIRRARSRLDSTG